MVMTSPPSPCGRRNLQGRNDGLGERPHLCFRILPCEHNRDLIGAIRSHLTAALQHSLWATRERAAVDPPIGYELVVPGLHVMVRVVGPAQPLERLAVGGIERPEPRSTTQADDCLTRHD